MAKKKNRKLEAKLAECATIIKAASELFARQHAAYLEAVGNTEANKLLAANPELKLALESVELIRSLNGLT
jgi:hypothetical protein